MKRQNNIFVRFERKRSSSKIDFDSKFIVRSRKHLWKNCYVITICIHVFSLLKCPQFNNSDKWTKWASLAQRSIRFEWVALSFSIYLFHNQAIVLMDRKLYIIHFHSKEIFYSSKAINIANGTFCISFIIYYPIGSWMVYFHVDFPCWQFNIWIRSVGD